MQKHGQPTPTHNNILFTIIDVVWHDHISVIHVVISFLQHGRIPACNFMQVIKSVPMNMIVRLDKVMYGATSTAASMTTKIQGCTKSSSLHPQARDMFISQVY